MNIRRAIDYSEVYIALDELMEKRLPKMELYREIGRLTSTRPEKGAAVMASEYLQKNYPDAAGFSPRNVRRMREFFRIYEGNPTLMAKAMKIGWTQNVLILEQCTDDAERKWYIQAVFCHGWSKQDLAAKISEQAHLFTLAVQEEVGHTGVEEGKLNGQAGSEKTPLQDMCDEKAGWELQQERISYTYMQNLFPTITGTIGATDNAKPPDKFAVSEVDERRTPMAGESNPRPKAESSGNSTVDLRRATFQYNEKHDKVGACDQRIGALHETLGPVSVRKDCCMSQTSPTISSLTFYRTYTRINQVK